jgi:arylsulfatase A-like enzyme
VRGLHLDSHTFVLFTSDNGGTPRAVNAPLRGFKGSTWEGGMREPTIAWWPGKIPADTATDAITAMFDVLPTLVHLAGGNVPTDRKLDGEDIWPVLAAEPKAKPPHEVFYFYRGLTLEGVRSGPWKLRLAIADQPAAKNPPAPAVPPQDQLYNLDSDIAESKNVAAENPGEVARLHALADAMKDDLGLNGIGPGVRPLGRVAHPQPLIGADGRIREGFAPK